MIDYKTHYIQYIPGRSMVAKCGITDPMLWTAFADNVTCKNCIDLMYEPRKQFWSKE